MLEKRLVRWLIVLAAILVAGQFVGWILISQTLPKAESDELRQVWQVFRGAGAHIADGNLVAALWSFFSPLIWMLVRILDLGSGQGHSLYRLGMWIVRLDIVAAYAWICWGAWTWRDMPIVRRAGALFALTGVVFATSMALQFAFHWESGALGLAGAWLMLVGFLLGLALIRALLMPGLPVLGVARTLIDEAIRMKIAGVFIVGLALLIPILPLILDPTERIQYRMQFLLTWSLTGTALLLSLLTIFLACGTICSEIKNGQIYLTMTKPVGRMQYLAGKLLGIVLLDLLLLSVAGVGIYIGARMLALTPDRGQADRFALFSEVLTARESVAASPPDMKEYEEAFAARLAEIRKGQATPLVGGANPAEREAITSELRRRWFNIPPGESHVYVYRGLQGVKKLAPAVQLRFKAIMSPEPPDKRIPLVIWLNDRAYPVDNGYHTAIPVANNTVQIVTLPTAAIDDDGNLFIRIMNNKLPGSITIESDRTGMQLLYPVGGFEPNFIRTLVILWFRLIFLAMVGLAAGTFLGFPVATLLSLVIFFAANFSTFIAGAIGSMTLGASGDGQLSSNITWAAFATRVKTFEFFSALKLLIGVLDIILVEGLGAYAEYDPVPLFTDGRYVSPALVGRAGFYIAFLWTLITAVIGAGIFYRRELARVTV